MRLRPFLIILTTSLLGACEKKDAAPGSQSPDIASTKSSLRDQGGEPRATRRERSSRSKDLESVDSLIRKLNSGSLGEEGRISVGWEVSLAIMAMDPDDFDAVWKMLGGLDDKDRRSDYQRTAIFHLAARKDLATSFRLTKELLFPGIPEAERGLQLGNIFMSSNPTLPEAIDLLRKTEFSGDRDILLQCFPHRQGKYEDLTILRESNYRLDDKESGGLVRGLVTGIPFHSHLGDSDGAQDLIDAVVSLESDGVLAKGSREKLFIEIGKQHPELFVAMIPQGKLESELRKEGNDPVIQSIASGEVTPDPFRVMDSDIPQTFFTPTGTQNLPPEKTALALAAWHSVRPEAAEKWFSANAATLPQSQQEQALAAFAKNHEREAPNEGRKPDVDGREER